MPEENCPTCREVDGDFYRCPRGASFDCWILEGRPPECSPEPEPEPEIEPEQLSLFEEEW